MYLIFYIIFLPKQYLQEEIMGYKEIGREISFTDLAVSKSLAHNRSVKMSLHAMGLHR